MKKYNFLLILALFMAVSCKKDVFRNSSEGTVLGFDGRKCGCCGGLFIRVGNDTLRTFSLPDQEALLQKPMPFRIKMVWERDTSACGRMMPDLIMVSAAKAL
jgi:hypothetical protein